MKKKNPLTEQNKASVFLANDSWFSHIALECPNKNCSIEWCEPVSDDEYNKL